MSTTLSRRHQNVSLCKDMKTPAGTDTKIAFLDEIIALNCHGYYSYHTYVPRKIEYIFFFTKHFIKKFSAHKPYNFHITIILKINSL